MTTDKQIAADRNLARAAAPGSIYRDRRHALRTRTQFQPAGSSPDATGNPNDFNALPNTAEAEQAAIKNSTNPFFIGSYPCPSVSICGHSGSLLN
jgi:hypothetical protein